MGLAEELEEFRRRHSSNLILPTTRARVCTATGAVFKTNVNLSRTTGEPNEQFYKWQLIDGLINAQLIPADCIGTELSVPRGSRASSNLFMDVAIFRDSSWVALFDELVSGASSTHTWDDLLELVVGCGEIKDDADDDPDRTVSRQLIPVLNSVHTAYSLGFYFNAGHLVLFSRSTETTRPVLARLDPVKQAPSGTGVQALNLAVPDTYSQFPPLHLILRRGTGGPTSTRAGRRLADLDITSSRSQAAVTGALDGINRILDQVSMGSEVGYRVVVETLAAKIYDEKRSEEHGAELDFYVDQNEFPSATGNITGGSRTFRDRIRALHQEARSSYASILGQSTINWANKAHLRIIAEVVRGFQDIAFTRSTRSDLYQVVFYNFAAPLSKVQQAQFITPLAVIDFMVQITSPAAGEDVCDPTMGIADFLAETFRYRSGYFARPTEEDPSDGSADEIPSAGATGQDERLFGMDNDVNMQMLAGLNMLLNGDGRARLHFVADTGSLDHKFAISSATGEIEPVRLVHEDHRDGDWDFEPGADHSLKRFDLILTNPPFGDQRALRLDDPAQGAANRSLASIFDIRHRVSGNQIDRGLLFLENAVHLLRENGRFGIILSTSLAGVREYEESRLWLSEKVRVVAIFDLPENIFAETGVPTTILVGYKPTTARLAELQELPYEVFARRIRRVGFFKATRRRTSLLLPKYLTDPTTGMVRHNTTSGEPLLDSEFDDVVLEFRDWAATQEPEISQIFLRSSVST